jgi:hypothetical protein
MWLIIVGPVILYQTPDSNAKLIELKNNLNTDGLQTQHPKQREPILCFHFELDNITRRQYNDRRQLKSRASLGTSTFHVKSVNDISSILSSL